jgi:hypothetical protein
LPASRGPKKTRWRTTRRVGGGAGVGERSRLEAGVDSHQEGLAGGVLEVDAAVEVGVEERGAVGLDGVDAELGDQIVELGQGAERGARHLLAAVRVVVAERGLARALALRVGRVHAAVRRDAREHALNAREVQRRAPGIRRVAELVAPAQGELARVAVPGEHPHAGHAAVEHDFEP